MLFDTLLRRGMSKRSLPFDLNLFKTQEMCERAIEDGSYTLKFVPYHLKTREMCERTIEDNLYTLEFVPDHLKT